MKIILAAALAALPALALAQAEKAAPAPKGKPAASAPASIAKVNGVSVPRSRLEFMMDQQKARGAQDNEQMRAMVREELVNREVIAQEAGRTGLAKKPEVQAELDLARQQIIVNAYLREAVDRQARRIMTEPDKDAG